MPPARAEQPRLLILASHPIQYQVPLFQRLELSTAIRSDVLFLSAHGVTPSYDPGFGKAIAYDLPLLEGYSHAFLRNLSPWPGSDRFAGLFNPAVIQRISRRNADLVLIHGYGHTSEWLAAATAVARRVPYLIRGETRGDLETRVAGLRRVLKRSTVGPLVRAASGCLTIGSHNRRFYKLYGVPDSRLFHSPYSVDNDSFAAAGARGRATRAERLHQLGLDPDRPVMLFAAKLLPRKRPHDFIVAASRLGGSINAIVIGDGPLRDQVERAAATMTNLRCLGFVNQSAIGEWYGVADVFVLPSDFETWGLAVNEAMAAGAIPVVSDSVGCAPDLVVPAGRVFPTGDIEGLVAAVKDVLKSFPNLQHRRQMGSAVVNEYSLEKTVLGIEHAVCAIAAARSSRGVKD